MAEILAEVAGRVLMEIGGIIISGAIDSYTQQRQKKKSISSSHKKHRSLTVTSPPSIQHRRAVLIVSSNITFGNDCERLVNIAFQTSQTFSAMMGTYDDVSRYLTKELAKQYPNEYFHIIIGQNEKFGFSVDDGQYYAEIVQDRYRVIIFTTKQNSHTKLDVHDANSQMLFIWK